MTPLSLGAALWLGLLLPLPAIAEPLLENGAVTLSWDNTLRYSTGFRLRAADPITLSYPNADDGDRNFAPGLMRNRLDLLSALDITSQSMGVQASVEAWYDSVYFSRTDNHSATLNAVSIPPGQFSHATHHLEGAHADLADTFIFGNFTVDEMPLSVRIGRQTLLWGESLFFDESSIAAAQAPADYIKSASTPNGYSSNAYLPVNQISFTLQPRPDIALSAYYQLEWRSSRLPSVGSYFSISDVAGPGAERALLSGGAFLVHAPNQRPSNSGQYGASLRINLDQFDLGLYALRYSSKTPLLTVSLLPAGPTASGYAGTFNSIFPEGIELYGLSASGYIGDVNVSGELSARRHLPLVSVPPISPYGASAPRAVGYAAGDVLHAALSATATLSPAALWDSADLSAELRADDILSVSQNAGTLGFGRDRTAAGARLLFQPHYFQVFPHLDLTPHIAVGYNPVGRSGTDYAQEEGTGDFELGAAVTYLSVWKADVTITGFVGNAARQPYADRDFILFSLERSF